MNELLYTELGRISEEIARIKEGEDSVAKRRELHGVFKR